MNDPQPPRLEAPLSFSLGELTERASNGSLPWAPFRAGVDRHVLYDEGPNGASAALLRYAPGAHVPTHEHTGYEHIFVLSGAQQDRRGRYTAGSVMISPPGSRHDVRSPDGCIVLAIWQRPVQFVAPEPTPPSP